MSDDSKVDESKLLDQLKKKAELLGISFSANIGMAKLKAKVDAFIEDQGGNEPVNETSLGPDANIRRLEAKAKKPILAVVRDLDSSQQNDPTIITNIGNKYFKIGCITQKGKEQVIPAAVIAALKAKTMVQWVDEKHAITKRPTGNKVARTTKRYSIEIVDKNPEMDK